MFLAVSPGGNVMDVQFGLITARTAQLWAYSINNFYWAVGGG